MQLINNKHDFNSALIGIILFDGSMPSDHQLYIRHGKKQFDYVDGKVSLLEKYMTPTSVRSSVDKKGFEYRYAYYNNPQLRFLYQKIYKNGKKVLTDSILNRFTELTLAIMYMDDGSLVLHKDPKRPGEYRSREIYLATHSFSLHENKKLQSMLLKRWGLSFRISKDRGYYRLCCNGANAIQFCSIVAPYVKHFPCMTYKLDFKYKKKQLPF